MERISASIRLGAVVLGSALLGACASSYQQGSTSSPAVTTVNGPVTSSTGTAAYHQQVLQARDNKTAACLQTEVSSGKLLYHSLVVPSGSFQIQADHTADAWRCIDYGNGGQQVWALLDPNSTVGQGISASAEPLGDGLLGIRINQTEDKHFLKVESLVPLSAAEESGLLQSGDLIVAIGEGKDGELTPTAGQTLQQLVAQMRGEPGTFARLSVMSPGTAGTRDVVLERRAQNAKQEAAIQQQQIDALAIKNNSGQYLSPYTSDGVTAEWVNKTINVSMGKATGSAVGGVAGAYAANKVLENVPFGGMLGGFLGSKAGKAVGGNTALEASGGWDFIRSSSDISFNSMNDMARWLATTHRDKSNFVDVIKAADKIYPGLQTAVANSAR
ncbi:MAG: PDZ domain-containing protein [Alcanivorax sp.]|jgi:Fe-S cluster assembly iron-binding protein IscA|uniref:PDZ domain-containing protein n=1 Tax=Alcanivorax sp. TaxID=1872427 RepID=UPI003C4643DE